MTAVETAEIAELIKQLMQDLANLKIETSELEELTAEELVEWGE
jgi:hypothetical protein